MTNAEDVYAYTKNLANTSATKNAEICRNTYDILTNTHTKINKIWENHVNQYKTTSFPSFFEKFQTLKLNFDNSPWKSWLNSTNEAMNQVSKLANEAAQYNHNNILAASETVKNVVNTAKAAATHSVETAKKAANETLATAKIAVAENLVTAKKAAAQTVEAVINSAKTVQVQAVDLAQKSTDAVVAATKKSADLVSSATKKPKL